MKKFFGLFMIMAMIMAFVLVSIADAGQVLISLPASAVDGILYQNTDTGALSGWRLVENWNIPPGTRRGVQTWIVNGKEVSTPFRTTVYVSGAKTYLVFARGPEKVVTQYDLNVWGKIIVDVNNDIQKAFSVIISAWEDVPIESAQPAPPAPAPTTVTTWGKMKKVAR